MSPAPGLATVGLLAVAALLPAFPAAAQEPSSAVLGDSIRVGDPVPVAIRISLDPGGQTAFPDTLRLDSPDLENAARVRRLADTLADGRVQVTAVYTVTPWRPGELSLPEVPILVTDDAGASRTVVASLPDLHVLSVLPADPDLLDPMPAKGVIGPSFAWWPFVLLAMVLLAAAAVGWWWLRGRRPAHVLAVAPAAPPRQRALEALDEARRAGFIERGEWKEFYTRVAHTLREYLEAIEPGWSEDLTTSELLAAIRVGSGHEPSTALATVLRPADQVKFARRVPDAETAIAEWEAARAWVQRYDGPPRDLPAEVAA